MSAFFLRVPTSASAPRLCCLCPRLCFPVCPHLRPTVPKPPHLGLYRRRCRPCPWPRLQPYQRTRPRLHKVYRLPHARTRARFLNHQIPCSRVVKLASEHHLSMQVHRAPLGCEDAPSGNGRRSNSRLTWRVIVFPDLMKSILHLKVQQAVHFRVLGSGNGLTNLPWAWEARTFCAASEHGLLQRR